MIVIIFRCRVRDGAAAEMEKAGARMYELASGMPGFVSYQDYQSSDGENVSVIEFESLETVAAWRDHPDQQPAPAADVGCGDDA